MRRDPERSRGDDEVPADVPAHAPAPDELRGEQTPRARDAGRSSARRHDTLRAAVIAPWCWDLIEPYLKRNLNQQGVERPSRREILEEFGRVWPDFTATIGVQEPWAGTIRFKWLVRLPSSEMESFLEDPTRWIRRPIRRRQVQDEPASRPALRGTLGTSSPRASPCGKSRRRSIWTRRPTARGRQMEARVDASGVAVELASPPRADRLARAKHHRDALRARAGRRAGGITVYCVEPRAVVRGQDAHRRREESRPREDPELEPDLVIANNRGEPSRSRRDAPVLVDSGVGHVPAHGGRGDPADRRAGRG